MLQIVSSRATSVIQFNPGKASGDKWYVRPISQPFENLVVRHPENLSQAKVLVNEVFSGIHRPTFLISRRTTFVPLPALRQR